MRVHSFRSFVVGSSAIASFLLAYGAFAVGQDQPKKPKREAAVADTGTPKIDGEMEDKWKGAIEVPVKKVVASETTLKEKDLAVGTVRLMWDKEYLYAFWNVTDPKLSASSSDAWAQDSVELFVDELNQHAGPYQKDDAQYRVSFEGKVSGDGPGFKESNVKAVAKKTETGYVVEMSVKFMEAKPKPGHEMGLELQINDDPGTGSRGGIRKWNHAENDSYQSTTDFGLLVLTAAVP